MHRPVAATTWRRIRPRSAGERVSAAVLIALLGSGLAGLLHPASSQFLRFAQSGTANAQSNSGEDDLLFANGFEALTEIVSLPVTGGTVGHPYSYDVNAVADPGLALSYTLEQSPAGMSIDPGSGLIEWMPVAAGDFEVTPRVDDSAGEFDTQTYTLTVTGNQPPAIVSDPVTTAVVGESYAYDVEADDPEQAPLMFSLTVSPAGMSVDQATGLIQWTPDSEGIVPVTVRVEDIAGAGDSQSFDLDVGPPPDQAPEFTSQPTTAATVDQVYTYDADAVDPEGADVTFELLDGPLGMRLDRAAGLIEWTPLSPATATVTLRASDPANNSTDQQFELTADHAPDQALPEIDDPGDHVVQLGETLELTITADSPNGAPRFFALPVPLPEIATFDSRTGEFRFTPQAPGEYMFTFGVGDGRFTDTGQITVTVPAPDPAAPTRFSGRLLDANDLAQGVETPIAGATVGFLDTGISVLSDANGFFALEDVPGNEQILDIDASTAAPAPDGSPYASFRERVEFFAHIDNSVERPFSLPRIDQSSLTPVDPDSTTVVSNQSLGVEVTIPAGVAVNPDGTPFTGELSISAVPKGFAPAVLPDGFDPALLITMQPIGVTFAEPVPTTFPNLEGYSAGMNLKSMALNHENGRFEQVGMARVTDDGDQSITVSGGLTSTSWHSVAPNTELDGSDNPQQCDVDSGSTSCIGDGSLGERVRLPVYRSLGNNQSLSLVYQSRDAGGNVIITGSIGFEIADVPNGSIGTLQGFRSTLTLGGITVSEIRYAADEIPNRIPIAAAGAGGGGGSSSGGAGGLSGLPDHVGTIPPLPPGVYQATLTATSFYQSASFSDEDSVDVFIPGSRGDGYGQGWSLTGQSQLAFGSEGSVVLRPPGASPVIFRQDPDSGEFVAPDAEFSTLTRDPASGELTLTDTSGNQTVFDSNGRQIATRDRNGNTTQYQYNSDRLTRIIDPTGLETRLEYSAGKLRRIVDPLGRSTELVHDHNGNLVEVHLADGQQRNFDYQGGFLMRQTDERGNTTEYTYDALGRVQQAQLPDGEVRGIVDRTQTSIPLDGAGSPGNPAPLPDEGVGETGRFIDARGNERSIRLDEHSRPLESTDALGRATRHERNADSLATRTTRPDGSETTRAFDDKGNVVTRTEQFNNATTTWTYDAFSQVTATTDPRGHTTEIERDANGNPTRITNALGHETVMEYNGQGLITRREDPNGLVTTFTYNAQGLPETVTEAAPDGTQRVTDNTYDLAGQLTSRLGPTGVLSEFDYDLRGRLTAVTDNLGQKLVTVYDAAGNVVRTDTLAADGGLVLTAARDYDSRERLVATRLPHEGGEAVSQLALGPEGNVLGRIDPKGQRTDALFDAVDRLTMRIDPLGGVTEFGYDALDNLVEVTAPNEATTSFEVDPLGRVTEEDSPDRGIRQMQYDSANNRTRLIDARGVEVNYSYDALNRLTVVDYPTDSEDVTFSYDTCPNGVGRLCGIEDGSGSYSFAYNAFGNRVEKQFTTEGVTYTTTMEYDGGDNLIAMTYPSGRAVLLTRDELRRVVKVEAEVNGELQTIVEEITYRADGQIAGATYGNGLVASWEYDLQGRMVRQMLEDPGTGAIVDERLYDYDANGNLIDRMGGSRDQAYRYDALDRLTGQDFEDGDFFDYSYDANGNRLSRIAAEDNLSETLGYCEDSNRLETLDRSADSPEDQPAVREWVYNDAGRMSEYLEDGEMVATYTVNALGQRVIKSVEGTSTVFHYDESGTLIGETLADGSGKRDYLWLNGLPLAQIDVQGGIDKVRYLHPDHLATGRLATDEMGVVVWRWEGEAFGDVEPDEDPDGDGASITINLRFPGQYADQESGVYQNYFRDYADRLGRYVQSDPIGLSGGENTYSYSRSNPLLFVDPLGLDVRCPMGQEAVPFPGLEDEFPRIHDCEPSPHAPNRPQCPFGECAAFPDTYNSTCTIDCENSRLAACVSITLAGSSPSCLKCAKDLRLLKFNSPSCVKCSEGLFDVRRCIEDLCKVDCCEE